VIQFTKNYTDRSNDQGFQFEFFCDKCGNGWMSAYQTNALGVAEGVVKAAGAIFGGFLGRAAYAGDYVKDSLRGRARDEAYEKAVVEGKNHFKQCTRCGHWVCPDNCWNPEKALCKGCAPVLSEEIAAAQAEAAKEQVIAKAHATDYVAGVDMTRNAIALCAKCGASVGAAKFCPQCGTAIHATIKCAACGKDLEAGAKFCPDCGAKRA
jgi:hypothetical protein